MHMSINETRQNVAGFGLRESDDAADFAVRNSDTGRENAPRSNVHEITFNCKFVFHMVVLSLVTHEALMSLGFCHKKF